MYDKEIQGGGNKNFVDTEELEINQDNYEEVFTPKRSVLRSPIKDMEQNVEENRPKRPRSGTDSPTSSDRQKIPKHSERTPLDTSEENCEQLKANINMEEQQSKALNNTNNMIEAILSDLKIIHGFSEKDSFEPSELTEMRKASFQLHEVVTRLAYKVGKLETENCLLNKALFELKNAPVTASTSEGEQIISAKKQVTQQSKSLVKTYSSIVT